MTTVLFSYGTLQLPKVQLASFGRLLHGKSDALPAYQLDFITINDEGVLKKSGQQKHPIARHTGNTTDNVQGILFELTTAELSKADLYEVADYQRIRCILAPGSVAWVYVALAIDNSLQKQ
jgi:hypothetical protein